ncbi:MAG: hypothetical protein M0R74_17230 [Dehalococcoidia bacterium]|nr:hypothetical protein [Dehalococcoidia bacterium]
MKFDAETELGKQAVALLTGLGWDVYQEVEIRGQVADVVAVMGNLRWIVECKLSLSLAVMGQALEWLPIAHYVSVAIPCTKQRNTKARTAAISFLRWKGIGLIELSKTRRSGLRSITVEPRLNRKAHTDFIKLNERQKTYADAGSPNGHWTPFQETCDQVRRLVAQRPGIILKELIDKISHHYQSKSTARACISRYAKAGIIKGIRCERDGGSLRFYTEETK